MKIRDELLRNIRQVEPYVPGGTASGAGCQAEHK